MTRQPKPTGRPPLAVDDETVRVGVSLPAKQYDGYAKRALREDVSVPEIIRRELRKKSTK
jgi:hypothetical protein